MCNKHPLNAIPQGKNVHGTVLHVAKHNGILPDILGTHITHDKEQV